jgi:hypothetical protein
MPVIRQFRLHPMPAERRVGGGTFDARRFHLPEGFMLKARRPARDGVSGREVPGISKE